MMRRARTSFEDLEVYQIAERLSDVAWDTARGWDGFARDTVGKQLVRAADGIGANLAEGAGRGTPKDNARFVRYARGSLYEVKHWLRRAHQRGLLTEKQTEHLSPLVAELLPRLSAYLNSLTRL